MKRSPSNGAVLAAALLVTVLSSCNWGSGGSAEEGTTTRAAGPPAGGEEIPASELRHGGRVVFVRGDGEGSRTSASGGLYVARLNGSKLRRLPFRTKWKTALGDNEGLENVATIAARWSPDGHSIALAQYGWAGDPWGWTEVVSARGRNRKVLTPAHPGGPYTAPSWSPRGDRLVIARNGNLELVSLSGGGPRRIRIPRGIADPDWSPNGREIAFSVLFEGIGVTSPEGEPLRYLAKGEVQEPAWSPDGARIAFARISPKRARGIWVVGDDGHDLRRLSSHRDESPRWSPDGSKILFRRLERHRLGPKSWELYVMDQDGGRETHLPFNRAPADPRLGIGILSADWG
jgi:dipeptidyl aminopeptidase/acylaminoacyl peptidase